jgi:hypothetical protein
MPLLDLPDQLTHRAYVRAVTAALTAAGVPVSAVSFPHDPDADLVLARRAVLDLDMRATWPVYGDQEVSLIWTDETGWSVGWGPAGDVCGASFTVCRSLVPEPAEVVAAALAAVTAPPTRSVPCPFRACEIHDEELETTLDAYTRRQRPDTKEPSMTHTPEAQHCPSPETVVLNGDGTADSPFVLDLGTVLRPHQECGCGEAPARKGDASAGEHHHTAGDVPAGSVTLCVVNGDRWHHTPVSAELWEQSDEETREVFRGMARRAAGCVSLPVQLVRAEDVGA